MILDRLINSPYTITFNSSFFLTLLVAIVSAFIAIYINAFFQAIFARILGIKEKQLATSFNPLKQFNFYNLFGITLYVFFGCGYSKAPKTTNSKAKDFILALSGPVLSVGLAILFSILYGYFYETAFFEYLYFIAAASVGFAVLNILPLPGCNGGNIISVILPKKARELFLSWSKYSVIFVVIAAGILARSGLIFKIISTILSWAAALSHGGIGVQ